MTAMNISSRRGEIDNIVLSATFKFYCSLMENQVSIRMVSGYQKNYEMAFNRMRLREESIMSTN